MKADLDGANFRWTNIKRAKFDGSNLNRTNLREAYYLTFDQFSKMVIIQHTENQSNIFDFDLSSIRSLIL